MVDKRGHEDGEQPAPDSKRPKLGEGPAPAAAGGPRVSAEMLAKLEKTKKLLQAQKELQEKLKKLPQVGREGARARCAARRRPRAAPCAAAARCPLRGALGCWGRARVPCAPGCARASRGGAAACRGEGAPQRCCRLHAPHPHPPLPPCCLLPGRQGARGGAGSGGDGGGSSGGSAKRSGGGRRRGCGGRVCRHGRGGHQAGDGDRLQIRAAALGAPRGAAARRPAGRSGRSARGGGRGRGGRRLPAAAAAAGRAGARGGRVRECHRTENCTRQHAQGAGGGGVTRDRSCRAARGGARGRAGAGAKPAAARADWPPLAPPRLAARSTSGRRSSRRCRRRRRRRPRSRSRWVAWDLAGARRCCGRLAAAPPPHGCRARLQCSSSAAPQATLAAAPAPAPPPRSHSRRLTAL
jgi:hypothetical protein